jgi:hypothetical protein
LSTDERVIVVIVHTVLRDCVYLNWAIPARLLPPAPEPLRYEIHVAGGQEYVFASALLFQQERLRFAKMPRVTFSYPQFNLRLYVLDGEGVPAVYFVCLMVPRWVVPGARWWAGQPVVGASFDYAQPSRSLESEFWSWSVRRGGRLSIVGTQGLSEPSSGPALGSLESKVEYFSRRERGYSISPSGTKAKNGSPQGPALTMIEARHRISAVWPLRVEVGRTDLLTQYLSLGDRESWPGLHSAWLCPEIPFSFELNSEPGKSKLASAPTSVAADPAMNEVVPGGFDPSIAA